VTARSQLARDLMRPHLVEDEPHPNAASSLAVSSSFSAMNASTLSGCSA
jgi:hypothetical protein